MAIFTMSEERYAELSEEHGGFCLNCQAEVTGVEPDARKYECEECGVPAVYGCEELLTMGLIEFGHDET